MHTPGAAFRQRRGDGAPFPPPAVHQEGAAGGEEGPRVLEDEGDAESDEDAHLRPLHDRVKAGWREDRRLTASQALDRVLSPDRVDI
eukprot:gene8573-biopygen2468